MAVKDGQTKLEWELLGRGDARHHQLGGPPIGSLYARRAEALHRKQRQPQLKLQTDLRGAALVALRESLDEADRAGEVLDCTIVRGHAHRLHPRAMERLHRAPSHASGVL